MQLMLIYFSVLCLLRLDTTPKVISIRVCKAGTLYDSSEANQSEDSALKLFQSDMACEPEQHCTGTVPEKDTIV